MCYHLRSVSIQLKCWHLLWSPMRSSDHQFRPITNKISTTKTWTQVYWVWEIYSPQPRPPMSLQAIFSCIKELELHPMHCVLDIKLLYSDPKPCRRTVTTEGRVDKASVSITNMEWLVLKYKYSYYIPIKAGIPIEKKEWTWKQQDAKESNI